MAEESNKQKLPNILVSGTPGVGKTTFCESIAEQTGLKHMRVNDVILEKKFHEGKDEERDCLIVDEDKVCKQNFQYLCIVFFSLMFPIHLLFVKQIQLCDYLEDELQGGGYVVDTHLCGTFPPEWFDLVIVLRCDNTVLYDRLQQREETNDTNKNLFICADRGYSQSKIGENVEAEIMQVVLDEALEEYGNGKVIELQNDTIEHMEKNIQKFVDWLSNWQKHQNDSIFDNENDNEHENGNTNEHKDDKHSDNLNEMQHPDKDVEMFVEVD
ncbi:hypothetical protein RFI_26927 [Reticulomyxa filosa]|uniref:Adenylate kinase isoenzyme 6 homolog n=1 Tax=Reticulomyxa filosa TaxID=46433 RepID=X6M9Y9_RETFI|nr:hypothetical protein RFI_26927 [Reticulomyxa filosa]|eukprot:ETO10451.1 hypothetical protein RFI_26927 [Reticulomyxa filosa]